MEIEVRSICGKYIEATASELHTGTLDKKQAVELVCNLLSVADDILEIFKEGRAADDLLDVRCYVESLWERL